MRGGWQLVTCAQRVMLDRNRPPASPPDSQPLQTCWWVVWPLWLLPGVLLNLPAPHRLPAPAARSDDWRIKVAMPIFLLIDALLKQRSVAQVLFNKFRTPENIKSVLQSVYGNAAAVDEELVELIYRPSCDQGALDAFVSIITGGGPRTGNGVRADSSAFQPMCSWEGMERALGPISSVPLPPHPLPPHSTYMHPLPTPHPTHPHTHTRTRLQAPLDHALTACWRASRSHCWFCGVRATLLRPQTVPSAATSRPCLTSGQTHSLPSCLALATAPTTMPRSWCTPSSSPGWKGCTGGRSRRPRRPDCSVQLT